MTSNDKDITAMRHPLLTIFLFITVFVTASCSMMPNDPFSPLAKTEINALKPGLQPRYFEKFFSRNVSELPDDDTSRYKNWQGEPILQLNNQFGRGEVFDSGTNRGIGIRMRGAFYFPESGNYNFQALSNDGIKMFFGEHLVVNDPVQHSDQLSDEGSINIPQAGWYPVRIDYFQRKGTAALKLFWKQPGMDSMEIVPATSYGHLPTM